MSRGVTPRAVTPPEPARLAGNARELRRFEHMRSCRKCRHGDHCSKLQAIMSAPHAVARNGVVMEAGRPLTGAERVARLRRRKRAAEIARLAAALAAKAPQLATLTPEQWIAAVEGLLPSGVRMLVNIFERIAAVTRRRVTPRRTAADRTLPLPFGERDS